MDADTTPMRYYKTGAWTIRALLAAFAAVFCLASPAGAWSFSEGAVAIHSNSSQGGIVPAVQVDSAGNIYACGYFKGSGDVDPDLAEGGIVEESDSGTDGA